jgi:hypothetical protein
MLVRESGPRYLLGNWKIGRKKRESRSSLGDASVDRARGVGSFGKLGIRNGFSYSDQNLAFGAAHDETERAGVATDSRALERSLSMPGNAPTVRIDAQIDKKAGRIIFVGDSMPNFIMGTSQVGLGAVPSLGAAYPDDTRVGYPKLIDDDVDVVLTSTPGITLEMLTRDCMAAIIVVKKPGVYVAGLLHAGWRQVDGGAGTRIANALIDGKRIQGKDVTVAIPPCLRKTHMVLQHLGDIADSKSWGAFITKEDDGYHVDFVGMFKKQLLDAGIPAENILDCGIDTYDAQATGRGHSARFQEERNMKRTSMLTVVHT